jgi:D-alanyl-D-alanine carboxypeptidase/D-alanyl-D-alanine-endopeptidase (penicillin-binding protein 4)
MNVTPLADVLWRCNTFSQNLFAECLLKSLAAYAPDGSRTGVAGSWSAGVAVLTRTLEPFGVDPRGVVFRDGSGLSHENRVSAAQVVQVLVAMHHHRHREVFVESLARPGEPGTMRRRYATEALRGRLRGKTGTISGVRALAGYITRDDGVQLAFALLTDGRVPSGLHARVAGILATTP